MLNHNIMVALANFGWAQWHIFLHRPGKVPVKFQIPRQRLMLKVVEVEGTLKAVTARHFYPKPQKV